MHSTGSKVVCTGKKLKGLGIKASLAQQPPPTHRNTGTQAANITAHSPQLSA